MRTKGKKLPVCVLPDDNGYLASHAEPDWYLCRSVSLCEVQGLGVFPIILFMLVAVAAWQCERFT